MIKNKYVGVVIGLFLLAAIAAWGVRMLVGLRQGGPAQPWIDLTYWLIALSAVIGGWAALFSDYPRLGRPFLLGFLGQVVCSVFVVAGVMGGGASAWTLMFWMVSALGWLPGYFWFFFTFQLLFSFWPKVEKAEDSLSKLHKEHAEFLNNLDDRLR